MKSLLTLEQKAATQVYYSVAMQMFHKMFEIGNAANDRSEAVRYSDRLAENIAMTPEVSRRTQGSKIVIAAIKKNGVVFTGTRHGHIIRDMVESGFIKDQKKDYVEQHEQGFVDDKGNYHSRDDARYIAIHAEQVKPDHGILYSEDLW